jgi:hypothetical protein
MMVGVIFQLDMFDFDTHMKLKIMKKYVGVAQFQLKLNTKNRSSGYCTRKAHEFGRKMVLVILNCS